MIKSSHLALAAAAVIVASTFSTLPALAENDTAWMYRPNQGYERQGYGSYRGRRTRRARRSEAQQQEERPRVSRRGRQNLGAPPAAERREPPEKLEGGPRPEIAAVAPRSVTFRSNYKRGTIVIDTSRRKLFYVLSENSAYEYPVSVGREGFQWSGTNKITRIQAWPSWHPPRRDARARTATAEDDDRRHL